MAAQDAVTPNACYRWAFTVVVGDDLPDETSGDDASAGLRAGDARVKRFNFQLERGEVALKYHWQGRLQLHDRKRRLQVVRLLADVFDVVQDNVTVRNEVSEVASMRYASKLETRVRGFPSGPFGDPDSLRLIREAESQVPYAGKDLVAIEGARRAWQRELEQLLRRDPDDRHVVWIHDAVGGTGKSKFIKWAHKKELATFVPLGKAQNINSVVITKGAHRAYMVDIPRVSGSEESQRDLFSSLEGIKNGMVFSSIYGANKELLMEPPHVVVFSNHMPNLSLCSRDRWAIYDVPGPDDPLVPVPLDKVREFILAAKARDEELTGSSASGAGSGAGAGASQA